MRSKKTIFIGLLTIFYVIGIVYFVDFDEVAKMVARISGGSLFIATVLVILAHVFALIRSGSVIGTLGSSADWRSLFLAFSAGNITNLSLNVVGQSLSRAMVLRDAGVPFSISVLGTYIERIMAAGLLFAFSLAGLWILFQRISLDLNYGAGDLIVAAAGIAIVATVVGVVVLRGKVVAQRAELLRFTLRLWPSIWLTVLVHAAGLFAYLILFADFEPQSMSMELIAALTIVMFVTSLPISFAGFGLRELSAASTLGLIGIAPNVAVTAAVLVGIIYVAVSGLFGVLALALLVRRPQAASVGSVGEPRSEPSAPRAPLKSFSDAAVVYWLAIICAVLIFFRVRAPVGQHDVIVNINVADLIVIAGVSIIALMLATGRLKSLFPSYMTWVLAGFSVVIAFGLVSSYFQDNLGGWALYTRGVGWIVALGYAFLGAAIVRVSGEMGRVLIVRTLLAAAVTICTLQLLAICADSFYSLPRYVLAKPAQGFANNQNAFSFDLAISGILLIAAKNLGLFQNRQWLYIASIFALAAVVFFAESRTGIVFVLLLAVTDAVLTRKSAECTSPMRMVTAAAAVGLLAVIVGPAIYQTHSRALVASSQAAPITTGAIDTAVPDSDPKTRFAHPVADSDRWATIIGGLRLWSERPILGAGIGAYYESERGMSGEQRGIHSIYISFLAEMGILGVLMLVSAGGVVGYNAWRMMSDAHSRPYGLAVLGALACMAIGGLVQDFFFQRIFWFVLGLATAAVGVSASSSLNDRVLLSSLVGFSSLVFLLSF